MIRSAQPIPRRGANVSIRFDDLKPLPTGAALLSDPPMGRSKCWPGWPFQAQVPQSRQIPHRASQSRQVLFVGRDAQTVTGCQDLLHLRQVETLPLSRRPLLTVTPVGARSTQPGGGSPELRACASQTGVLLRRNPFPGKNLFGRRAPTPRWRPRPNHHVRGSSAGHGLRQPRPSPSRPALVRCTHSHSGQQAVPHA